MSSSVASSASAFTAGTVAPVAAGTGAMPLAASPSPTGAATPSTGTAAGEQATAGAQQTQAEPFNAPKLVLPKDPTTQDVMNGLVRAMRDPTINKSTAQQLYQLHEQLRNAEQAMMQVIIDGMSS